MGLDDPSRAVDLGKARFLVSFRSLLAFLAFLGKAAAKSRLIASVVTALCTSNAVSGVVSKFYIYQRTWNRAGAPRKAVHSRQELEQLGRQKRGRTPSQPLLSAAYVPQKLVAR